MMRLIRMLGLFLCCSVCADAQTTAPPASPIKPSVMSPAKPPAQATAAEAKARAQRGLELLSEAGNEAGKLDDDETSARLLAKVADLIWKRAPEQAREYARKAFERALEHLQDDKPLRPAVPPNKDLHLRYQLCQQVIQVAQQHDAEFGQALVDKFNGPWAKLREAKRQQGLLTSFNDSYLLGNAPDAAPLLPRVFSGGYIMTGLDNKSLTPQGWVNQAMQVLANSFPADIMQQLWYVADRDRAAADQLFLFLLQRIQADETAGPLQLLVLAAYPFGDHSTSYTDGLRITSTGGGTDYYARIPALEPRHHRPALLRDEWLIHCFLQTALSVLQRTTTIELTEFPNAPARLGAGLCLALWLEPRVAALQPQLLPAIQQLAQTFKQRMPLAQAAEIQRLPQKNWAAYYDQDYHRDFPDQKLSVEAEPIDMIQALVNRAQRSRKPAERDFFFQEAAQLADREGQQNQALELAERITDLGYRRAVREWLTFNAAQVALAKRQFDEALRLAEAIKAIDLRTWVRCQIADAWVAKQRTRALNLLNDAETQARNANHYIYQVRALWLLSNSFAGFDQQRAQDALTELVYVVNKLPDFRLTYLRMGRLLEHPAGLATGWPRETLEWLKDLPWEQPFATLARSHFEEVLGQVQTVENKPLKLAALIGIAPQLFEPASAPAGAASTTPKPGK